MTLYFLSCPEKFSICGNHFFSMARASFFFLPALIGLIPSSVASIDLACLERLTACLKSRVGICFRPVLLALSPRSKSGIFLHHVGVKIVLPLRQIRPVAYDFFSAQAVVLCQRNESQMQVGRFLVHMYHRRHDIFPAYPINEKVCRPLEKGLYLLWGLPLEKLRAGGDERIHKPGAVLACPAPRLFNAALNEMVVSPLRLNDVKIVFAPAGVNVGIAGVLVFLSFCLSWWASSGLAGLPLCFSNRKIACCAINSFPHSFPIRDFSTGKSRRKYL